MKETSLSRIEYDSARGQTMTLLLAVLEELRGSVSKRDAIAHIVSHRFFDIHAEDYLPYPSAQTHEPRWHCLRAWARKDCVRRGWLFGDERDSWGITRDGIVCHQNNRRRFLEGKWKAKDCYLWTSVFKKMMQPNYQPSPDDASRPLVGIYRDSSNHFWEFFDL